MDALIGLFSLLILAICIIGLIYSAIRKKSKKKWSIGLIVGVVLLCIALAMPKDETTPTNQSTTKIEEPAPQPPKELTAEEQKQAIIAWHDNIADILHDFDTSMQPFQEIMIGIQNKTITDPEAIEKAKQTQQNIYKLEEKINNLKAPEGLNNENKQALDKVIADLKNGVQEQKNAIQYFIDGINNVDKPSLEQSMSKFTISKEHYSNAMRNLGVLYGNLGIDVNSLKR